MEIGTPVFLGHVVQDLHAVGSSFFGRQIFQSWVVFCNPLWDFVAHFGFANPACCILQLLKVSGCRVLRECNLPGWITAAVIPSSFRITDHLRTNLQSCQHLHFHQAIRGQKTYMFNAALATEYAFIRFGRFGANWIEPRIEVTNNAFFVSLLRTSGRNSRNRLNGAVTVKTISDVNSSISLEDT